MTFFLLALLLLPAASKAQADQHASRYDVLYIWAKDLNNLQDYKEELENQLGGEVGRKLRIVQRGDRYGIIYALDTTALSAAKMAVRHSLLLGKAGLGEARAIKDEGFQELYNVCYGHGPNLEALTEQYGTIYRALGTEIGKDLVIEKGEDGKYTLVYRRVGDKQSTMAVARQHAKLLGKRGIPASITREDNNEVVFGESSLLDHEEKDPEAGSAATAPEPALANKQKISPEPVPVLTGVKKTSVGETKAVSGSNLEKELEEYLDESRRTGQVAKDEKTGWLVIDLTKGKTIADINGAKPYQAASMIKPFIALAFFHRVKEGKLTYTAKAREEMEEMIQRSNNDAANWLLKQVGGPKAAQKIFRQHYGQLLQETSLVEYIPSGGRTYRNKASAEDYGRFLVALWRNQLPSGKEIRRVMALPGRDRLYCGTTLPKGTLIYDKTGTTAKLCGDMGILVLRAQDGRRYPYVVVGIIEKQGRDGNYGRWEMARGNVIRHVSSLTYQKMKADYHLL
ncbi:MAG: serine hydrolase [Desulfurivibrionaceae bacterium]